VIGPSWIIVYSPGTISLISVQPASATSNPIPMAEETLEREKKINKNNIG
jgi:hypothetical protein